MSVAGGCSVELTTRETVCLKTGMAPSSTASCTFFVLQGHAPLSNTNGASVGPFHFRSILVSLNAVHRFQLHRNGICFRLNGTERNGNVTVFMPPSCGREYSHLCTAHDNGNIEKLQSDWRHTAQCAEV